MWFNPYSLANCLKRSELYWGPFVGNNDFRDTILCENRSNMFNDTFQCRLFESGNLYPTGEIINYHEVVFHSKRSVITHCRGKEGRGVERGGSVLGG